ncbi:Glucose dehydrogenase/choline dehydrogenase/mandelonitrile lyase (GMC oxidoreductase family) [Handroanthus impetiginosus]|uniref:Long-chain-alcohol oxidase n=1 Tax=Handroanthus impetiginosus TaxID=429701 RepID=A0A2G9H4Y4_9LAMI|nr:Glucose dehydrogenase/choline dehydrogenase/mandelonitrile lyase (GMC oxidoreductase family) [Handroanthus impetiginosus]
MKCTAFLISQVNEKDDQNISWKAIGYPGPDPARKLDPKNLHHPAANQEPQECQDKEDDTHENDLFGPLYKGIINLNQDKEISFHKLHNMGFPISIPHSKNTRNKSLNPSFIIRCDAVVVGSGSGGGVIAGVLAKAGYKVLVLERGSYLARRNLSLLEGEALDQMYLGNGIIGTDNMDVLLLAGSTVGGGSMINWSASIQTPSHVRKEWSEKYGLQLFKSKAYEQALDVVSRKMGVQSEVEQEGFNNMILRKGCENLGYHIESVAINAPSDHYCGWCCFGCKDGRKKGTSETWLVDLVESRNGIILPECEAIKVMTEKKEGRKRAIGVAFEFQTEKGKEVAVAESKVTVTACGAICTPGLLKRSGLKNRNIGKNFHVHPVVMAWGYFPEPDPWLEAKKKSYEGGIITAMSKVVANHDTSGYGAIIQTPSLHPGFFSVLMPWISGTDIKNRMLKFSRTAHIFALARDKGSGTITSETDISYRVEDYDRESLGKGMEKVLRILAAAGAEEIGTHHNTGKVLKVKQASYEEFERFVKEESSRPLKKLSTPMCSAHQMGSCRMGIDPKGSVVNEKGETWEVERLFVADSSVFPTALGVNPMVTIQATAYCTAQSVLEVLGRERAV